jgi:malate synthase
MTKAEAIAVLNTAVDCYIEDCISTSSTSERAKVWQAYHLIRNVLERSIAEEGDES